MEKRGKAIAFTLVALSVALFLVLNVHIIPTGYTGVKVRLGQIQTEPVQSGQLLFTLPFVERIYKVNNKQQELLTEAQIWGETDDKTPVYAAEVSVTYQIMPGRSVWIYTNVSDYTRNLLSEGLISSAVKSAMVELSPADVTNRSRIEPLVQNKLEESLAGKYGEGTVEVCKVVIGDMDFEEAYNQAIQAKSIAAQQKAKAAIENQTAIEKAQAEKQVMLLKAQAKAEKVRIAAEAEAEANKKIQESLSEELIELRKIEAWDGKLPGVMGSDIGAFLGIGTEKK